MKTTMLRYGTWCWSPVSPAIGITTRIAMCSSSRAPETLQTEHDDGRVTVSELELGQVVKGIHHAVHRVTNIGGELYSNAIIEMKD